MLFETSGGASSVEIFVNSGFGYQVRCEAVCEGGSARIGDDRTMVVTTGGVRMRRSPRTTSYEFAGAYDREVQAWVDATRQGRVAGPSVWDGYAAAAVRAGVRALESGVRQSVELARDRRRTRATAVAHMPLERTIERPAVRPRTPQVTYATSDLPASGEYAICLSGPLRRACGICQKHHRIVSCQIPYRASRAVQQS